jgi:hypothetical protein
MVAKVHRHTAIQKQLCASMAMSLFFKKTKPIAGTEISAIPTVSAVKYAR